MKKKPEKPENHERWLLTYSDLITLLMIFFVIMYASSNLDAQKYQAISSSFKDSFGSGKNVVTNGGSGTGEEVKLVNGEVEKDSTSEQFKTDESSKLDQVQQEVDKLIDNSDLKENVSTSIEERGLVISFKNNVFFDSGKADLREEMKGKLNSLANILNKIDNYVRVEGHTDNLPINTKEFHSNWQLSSLRAANVVEYLVVKAGLAPNRLSSVGYGEYRPSANNDSEAGRSKNRRVDIVILNSKFNTSENKTQ